LALAESVRYFGTDAKGGGSQQGIALSLSTERRGEEKRTFSFASLFC
jgi:hypothetical protein